MDVQISAGKFKGKKLRIPDTATDFRPTKQIVREAVCSSLQMSTVGAKVLELCAGSGVFSFEMLSRGAEHATMVELSSDRIALIRKTVHELNVSADVTVLSGDLTEIIKSISSTYDIIFFDPPYKQNNLTSLIPQACSLLASHGVLVFEHATDDTFASQFPTPDGLENRSKKYGQSTVRYFRKEE